MYVTPNLSHSKFFLFYSVMFILGEWRRIHNNSNVLRKKKIKTNKPKWTDGKLNARKREPLDAQMEKGEIINHV